MDVNRTVDFMSVKRDMLKYVYCIKTVRELGISGHFVVRWKMKLEATLMKRREEVNRVGETKDERL